MEDYDESIRLAPQASTRYYNRGDAYTKLGQHQRTIEDYNESIRLDPEYVAAFNNRALAYNNLN